MSEELKFTKCECCPYYAKIGEEWKCSRMCADRKCVFDFENGLFLVSSEVLKNWLNANNGIEVKDEIKK